MDRKKMTMHLAQQRKHQKALLGDFVPEDVHMYRINRHTFTVYVGGDPWALPPEDGDEPGVEWNMADRHSMNLDILSGADPKRPICIEISSCGGYWEEGMQMAGKILTCPNPVTVIATKWARSMTSLIPLFADRFVIQPPGQYMYHRGTFGFHGLDQEAETADRERRKSREMMMRIYIARLKEQGKFSRRSENSIRAMLDKNMKDNIDVWLSADEAVEWGFADAVYIGDEETLRAKKKNTARRKRMMEVLRKPIAIL